MKGLHTLTFILLVVGGLNWGLEVFGWGIGRFVPETIANAVYLLVALAAVVEVATHKSYCNHCCAPKMGPNQPM